MAYSRWSSSVWYTFWTWSGDTEFKFPTQKLKNTQTFEICDMVSYYVTYEELDELGVDIVIDQIREFYSKPYKLEFFKTQDTFKKDVTEEELEELKGYLLKFMDDVDKHFKWKEFFKYEWYYPIRNKIKLWFKKL